MSRLTDKEGIYDQEIINNIIRSMEAYPSAVFLDVGAHMGSFTVVIAAMKRRVIAVDADPKNLAYIKQSLDIAKTTDYVELIYNAIRWVIKLDKSKFIGTSLELK